MHPNPPDSPSQRYGEARTTCTRASRNKKRGSITLLAAAFALLAAAPLQSAGPAAVSAEVIKGTATTARVDPVLFDELAQRGTTKILVYLRERPDLSPAFDMNWEERGWYVYEESRRVAETSQANLRAWLDGQGMDYKAFWIDNLIIIEQAGRQTLDTLRTMPEVRTLAAEPEIFVIEPEEVEPAELTGGPRAPESNLVHVGATEVWDLGYTGEGLVVGSIDTGVHYTHESLVNQYRGNLGDGNFDHNYNWWNPHTTPTAPFDWNGHGTHTVGTMVGDNGADRQTGMAPGATWIGCPGFNTDGTGPWEAMMECGQFMAAPTDLAGNNPDPDRRAHVVNNSWGNCQQVYNDVFEGVIDAWIAAGIVPVTSNGNASNCGYSQPPGLNTVGNPARSGKVLGIGSTGTSNGEYAPHSNWGPTDNPNPGLPEYPDPMGYPHLKPNVMAPGVSILAAYVLDGTNDTYAWSTGTSMSGPHVAGLIPLMWQAAPCLVGDYATTGTIIMQTARPIDYPSAGTPPPGPDNHPNYATGWGEIDALNAVAEAQVRCGPHGQLLGTVTSAATGTPIAGVNVVIDNPAGLPERVTTRTDANGQYRRVAAALEQPDGSYTVTFSRDGGYGTTEVTLVEIQDGQDYELNVSLDAGLLNVPEQLTITVPHGQTAELEVELANLGTLATPVELELFSGLREEFESDFPVDGWTVINHDSDCVWARNDEVEPHDDEPVDPVHGGRPNFAGGAGFSAIADADACGPGTTTDSSLISPPVDMRATGSAELSFLASYYHLGNSSFGVFSTMDNGDTWHQHLHWTHSVQPFGPGHAVTVNLDEYLGEPAVQVRFRYAGLWDWWAQVDQIRIITDLPWATLADSELEISPDSSEHTQIHIDSTGLPGPGTYTFTLLVEHHTPEQASPIHIPVTVEVLGEIDLPILHVEPTDLNFGQVEIGGAPTLEFTIANAAEPSAPALELATLELTDGAPEFQITGGDCTATTMLEPGQTCATQVAFAPESEGSYTGEIAIAGADGQDATVSLEGSGQQTPLPPGLLAVSPGSLDFGQLDIGASDAQGVTVTNVAGSGAAPLLLQSLEITGNAAFEITGGNCTAGHAIQPGQSCIVVVTFTAQGQGDYGGELTIETADAQSEVVPLSGAGPDPESPGDAIFRDRFEPPRTPGTPPHPASDITLEVATHWGGPVRGADIHGNYAYIANGRMLRILDISDETNPVEIGAIQLGTGNSGVRDVKVTGDYAFVAADGDDFFSIVDVSKPAAPVKVRSFSSSTSGGGHAHTVAIYNNHAYVSAISAASGTAVRIYDISSPPNAAQVGTLSNGVRGAIAQSGNYLYVGRYVHGGGSGPMLEIYDLSSNPASPPLVSAVGHAAFQRVIRLAAHNGFVYVVLENRNAERAQLWTIDFSNLAAPEITDIKTLSIANAYSQHTRIAVDVDEERLYFVNQAVTPRWYGVEQQIVVFDLQATPGVPSLHTTYDQPHGFVTGALATTPGRLYIADSAEGFVILDTSDLSGLNDPVVGKYHSPAVLRKMVLDGDLLYVTDAWGGFTVLDVSDTAAPVVVGHYLARRHDTAGIDAWAIEKVGDLVYLAAGSAGLLVVDVSDPANPFTAGVMRISTMAFPSNPWCGARFLGLRVRDDIAYIGYLAHFCTSATRWLLSVDVSNPAAPVALDILGAGSTGNHLYQAPTAMDFGPADSIITNFASTYDISDPAAMAVIHQSSAQAGSDLIVRDGLRYTVISGGGISSVGGLWIYDVTNPANPVPMVHLSINSPTACGGFLSFASALAFQEGTDRLYVRAHHGLLVFDVADSFDPVCLHRLQGIPGTGSDAYGLKSALVVDEPRAFVTSEEPAGLTLINVHGTGATTARR